MTNFLKKAIQDMKESAKAQHEVDKANFSAAKAEAKAQWEEAKAMSKPDTRQTIMRQERDRQLEEANARQAAAQARIDAVKNK
ncbi:MAG: hypothetical protein E7324_03980 [Clostridiales bacterium]|nr:hypothetical protein [Clostridiales bacterium]